MWFPPEMIAALQGQAYRSAPTTASGIQSSGNSDPAWAAWQSLMKEYSGDTNSGGLPKLNFWLVISLPGESYSEKLDWHDKVPMLMPASGTGILLGLAQTKEELEEMMFEDAKGKDGKPGNVHLTYKVKVQGQNAWRDLLDFLAEHDMLEQD
jgi:hypothetical protein